MSAKKKIKNLEETTVVQNEESATVIAALSSNNPDTGVSNLLMSVDTTKESQPAFGTITEQANVLTEEDAASILEQSTDDNTSQETAKVPKRQSILAIGADTTVITERVREETAWHEIRTAYHMHRILTGVLSGVEKLENGTTVTIILYNAYRVIIPFSELMISINEDSKLHSDYAAIRYNKILTSMLGAEIDFVIKGIETKSRSIVASRKEAIMRKRKIFYMDTDSSGMYRINENRIVQARVLAVGERVIRVDVFGSECSIHTANLSWEWMCDARERYSVGDRILVRVLTISRDNIDSLTITADVKSLTEDTSRENLKKCRKQCKYAGAVTGVFRGVVFVRLNNGANAIAHACYDRRTPGKKDEVSFSVTQIDEEQGIAIGVIPRIIRQHI